MTTEERTELDRHEARLEQLEREVGLIAGGEAANAQRISDTQAELERQRKQINDRVTVLDFELTQKLDALSAEHVQHKALLEDVQRQVLVIAEGHVTNEQNIKAMQAALEHQIQQVDHRVMVLDIKVHGKLEALEARMDSKLDSKLESLEARMDSKLESLEARMDSKLESLEARMDSKLDSKLAGLEARMDSKFDALGKELSRIAAHLGLDGAPHPAKHL